MKKNEPDPYAEITHAIRDAGFFVVPAHSADPFPRICPASKRREGGGYTGNSFWIAEFNGKWFVGAWGGWIYKAPGANSLGEFAVEWLTHKSNETSSDFDDWIIQKYQLSLIDNDKFDRLTEKM